LRLKFGTDGRTARPGHLTADHSTIEGRLTLDQSHEPFRALFTLKNTGGLPVTIDHLQSSCTCTKATVSPQVIPPGAEGVVTVVVTPAAAGRVDARVDVHTAAVPPETIGLQVRVETLRKVPFLFTAGGELMFLGGSKVGEARDLYVTTLEATQSGSQAPLIDVDLPCVTIEPPTVTREPYEQGGEGVAEYRGTYICKYVYPIRLTSTPPPGDTFDGRVRITDPWDPSHVVTEVIRGESANIVRVIPPRLVLHYDVATKRYRPATCLTVSKSGHPVRLIPESTDSPLKVASEAASSGNRFEVSLGDASPQPCAGGVHYLQVVDAATSELRRRVSVTIEAAPR